MRFVIHATSQFSSQRHPIEFEYPDCPPGFAVNISQGLDWTSLSAEMARALGYQNLTNGEFLWKEQAVEFTQTSGGRKLRVFLSAYPQLVAAVEWWHGYQKEAAIARDRFWDAEIDKSSSYNGRDFGEQFL